MKALIIENMTVPDALGAFLFRRRRRIHYFRTSARFKGDFALQVLKRLGFLPLSFEELGGGSTEFQIYSACARWAQLYVDDCVKDSPALAAVSEHFSFNSLQRSRFLAGVESTVISRLYTVAQLHYLAAAIAQRGGEVEIQLENLDHIVRHLRRAGAIQFNLRAPSVLSRLMGGASAWTPSGLLRTAVRFVRAFAARQAIFRVIKNRIRPTAPVWTAQDREWLRQVPVAYFPHQGIWYGDMFVKDHFYDPDPESPFFRSRIAHLAVQEKHMPPELFLRSEEYYRAAAIKRFHLEDAPTSGDVAPFPECKHVLPTSKDREAEHAVGSLCRAEFAAVHAHLDRLASFPKLKVVLVGYDILFPPALAVALSLKGMVTVAIQERFIFSFYPLYHIAVDLYFTAGPAASRALRAHPRSFPIGAMEEIGLYRTDMIREFSTKDDGGKYAAIKKSRKLILALDYHAAPDQDQNRLCYTAHWKHIKKFYRDMIRLAAKFPDIHILIKGKNNDILTNLAFADIVSIIRGLENMSFEEDRAQYPTYRLAAAADAAIALQTSLADEMIAVGKPVMIYDYDRPIAPYFNYDDAFMVYDYESLEAGMKRFVLEGSFIDPARSDALRRDYFSSPSAGAVKTRLKQRLRHLLETRS